MQTTAAALLALSLAAPAAAGPAAPWRGEELLAAEGPLRVAFTGHTYSLMLRDLQFHLADRVRAARPDLVVLGGDVVPGSDSSHLRHDLWNRSVLEEQWAKYRLFRERFAAPVILLPGNHDLYHRGMPPEHLATLARYAGLDPAWSGGRFGPFRLFFLNTMDVSAEPHRHTERLDPAQLAWLQAELAAAPDDASVLLFMHHQLWNLAALPGGRSGPAVEQFASEVSPALERFASVWLFAGDGAPYELDDGRLHYRVFANSFSRMGFYLIALDTETGTVASELRTEPIPRPELRPSVFLRDTARGLLSLSPAVQLTFLLAAALAALLVLRITLRALRR